MINRLIKSIKNEIMNLEFKIERLQDFIESGYRNTEISNKEYELLEMQLAKMIEYKEILERRLRLYE